VIPASGLCRYPDTLILDVPCLGEDAAGADLAPGGGGVASCAAESFSSGAAAHPDGERVMVLTDRSFAGGAAAVQAARGEEAGGFVPCFNTPANTASLLVVSISRPGEWHLEEAEARADRRGCAAPPPGTGARRRASGAFEGSRRSRRAASPGRPRGRDALDGICVRAHVLAVTWPVEFHPELEAEFPSLPEEVQDELLARAALLREFGPGLGRPAVDTLRGSRVANLKELRFGAAGGVWRVVFAFDHGRVAVLLAAGDKRGLRGGAEERFYKGLIALAERRLRDR
jgi:hypothetical protein